MHIPQWCVSLFLFQRPSTSVPSEIETRAEGEDNSPLREQRIRHAGIAAITQSTATAKSPRALPVRSIDFDRSTKTKDAIGGWNGPCPVVKNEQSDGSVICKHGGRELRVNCISPRSRKPIYGVERTSQFIDSCTVLSWQMSRHMYDIYKREVMICLESITTESESAMSLSKPRSTLSC